MRSIFQIFIDRLFTMGLEYFGRFYGMYRGTCKDNEDPEEQGRILVRVPAVTGKDTHGEWAWPIMPWAGKDSGDVKVPDVNDPVYVVFENGDPNEPMYIGGWCRLFIKMENLPKEYSKQRLDMSCLLRMIQKHSL